MCGKSGEGLVKNDQSLYDALRQQRASGKPDTEGKMARPRQSIIEYRSYNLSGEIPLMIHNRMNWQISPVRSSRLHVHNCFEIGMCFFGGGKISFGEEEIPFREGDVLFVGRNVPHTTWSAPDTGSTWKYIHVDPEALLGEETLRTAEDPERFGRMLTDCHMLLSSAEQPWAMQLAQKIEEEAARRESGCFHCIHGLCEVLFFRLFRLFADGKEHQVNPYTLSALSPALDYVNRHYLEQFSQDQLALECHMSPTHFRRRFQQQFGTNPLSYLHQVRIAKSCELLRETADNISRIAEAVGYTSLSCFNRHFYEQNQCTPTEWRGRGRDVPRATVIGLAGWDRPETSDEIEARNRTDRSDGV